jgi:hypothetical protein
MFHRIGVGVDGIHGVRAAQADALKAYDIVVLAAALTLDSPAVVSALEAFVRAAAPCSCCRSWPISSGTALSAGTGWGLP